MSKVRVIVLAVATLLLSVGLAMVAYSERKKTNKQKPIAGSPEQLELARKAKAKKAEAARKEAEEAARNIDEEIETILTDGSTKKDQSIKPDNQG